MKLLPTTILLSLWATSLLFAQTLYPVKRAGKWGYIDSTGKVVIPLKYDRANDFWDKYAPVLFNGKWGVIDQSERWIYEPRFDGIVWIDAPMMCVLEGTDYNIYNIDGHCLSEEEVSAWRQENSLRFNFYGSQYERWRNDKAHYGDVWENRRMVQAEGRYGYLDSSGVKIIPLQYDNATPFYRGLALVNIGARLQAGRESEELNGGVWGVIDALGKIVVPIIYDRIDINSDGRTIVVSQGKKKGLYSHNGRLLATPDYNEVSVVNDSLIVATIWSNGKEPVFNLRGRQNSWNLLPVKRSGLLSFCGDTLLPFNYRSITVWDSDRFLVEDSTGHWGVVALHGQVLLAPTFGSLGIVDSKTLIAGVPDTMHTGESIRGDSWERFNPVWYSIIDITGRERFPGRWREIRLLKDSSLFIVSDEVHGKGVVRSDGRILAPQDWYDLIFYRNGLIYLSKDTSDFYFINRDASLAFDRCFSSLDDFSADGTLVTVGRQFSSAEHDAIIDSTGKLTKVFSGKQGLVRGLSNRYSEGLMPAQYREEGIYFLDVKGEPTLGLYMAAEPFGEGLAAVAVEDKKAPEYHHYGFIDHNGTFIIPPRFDSAGFFREGVAPVAVSVEGDLKWGFIDREGKWVIEPQFGYARPFSDGRAVVFNWTDSGMVFENYGCIGYEKYDRIGKWGVIDKSGTAVIPTIIDYLHDFHNGAASARNDSGWGIIDRNGSWITPPKFSWMGEFTGELAPATMSLSFSCNVGGEDLGFVDRFGMWVIVPQFQHAGPFFDGKAVVKDEKISEEVRYINADGKIIWQE